MNHYQDDDRVIAFAGMYQAAALVHQLATQGKTDAVALTATLNSLFVENPESTRAVFGDLLQLKLGLRTLRIQMGNSEMVEEKRNLYISQYVVGMIALEKQMRSDPAIEETIFRRLSVPLSQSKHFGLLHENTASGLALIYSETLSRLRPKILVHGAHGHLTQPLVANRIRACLLAGVRAARLWRQVGGSRWHLIFQRGRYLRTLDRLLEEIRQLDREDAQVSAN
jgi:high frequency lysogenization protein